MYKLFIAKNEEVNNFVFLDNDFLSALFSDADFLEQAINFFQNSTLMIDPLTKLEFLRDVFLNKQKTLKETFINNPIFLPAINQNEQITEAQKNAIFASQIIALKKAEPPDLVDLLLIGRSMLHQDSLIATGNKKHYSSILFDTVAILSYEKNEKSCFSHYYILKFNQEKFSSCYSELEQIINS